MNWGRLAYEMLPGGGANKDRGLAVLSLGALLGENENGNRERSERQTFHVLHRLMCLCNKNMNVIKGTHGF